MFSKSHMMLFLDTQKGVTMRQLQTRPQPRHYLMALCSVLVVLIFAASIITLPRPGRAEAAPASLTLTFTCAQAVDYQSGKVCVHTQPGAALTIKVKYCSGYYATSKSLQGTKIANSSGNYTWHWVPETKCRGSATAYVTAKWNGQTVSKSDVFTVK